MLGMSNAESSMPEPIVVRDHSLAHCLRSLTLQIPASQSPSTNMACPQSPSTPIELYYDTLCLLCRRVPHFEHHLLGVLYATSQCHLYGLAVLDSQRDEPGGSEHDQSFHT